MKNLDDLTLYAHGLMTPDEEAAMKVHLDACPPCSDLITRLRRERGAFERAAARESIDPAELVREAERLASLPAAPRRPRSWLPVGLAAGLLLSLAGLLLHGSLFDSPAQDADVETIRKSVKAWLKDRKLESKGELLKVGTPAIPLLWEELKTASREDAVRLSDLLLTLKFRDQKGQLALETRDRLSEIRTEGDPESNLGNVLSGASASGDAFHCFVDPIDGVSPDNHPAALIEGRGVDALDHALPRAGYDWAYRYGLVLVSTPEKLWGRPGGKEPPFWNTSCAMDRQALSDGDKSIANHINDSGVEPDLECDGTRLDVLTRGLGAGSPYPFECPELIADLKISLRSRNLSLRNTLLLLTRLHGLDFCVKEGKVWIDLKENVDKLLK